MTVCHSLLASVVAVGDCASVSPPSPSVRFRLLGALVGSSTWTPSGGACGLVGRGGGDVEGYPVAISEPPQTDVGVVVVFIVVMLVVVALSATKGSGALREQTVNRSFDTNI